MLNLKEKVIKNGYCIGCGACTLPDNSPYKIITDNNGLFQADVKVDFQPKARDEDESDVCPFFNGELNEDSLAAQLYKKTNAYDSKIGYHHKIYTGHVVENDYFQNGSSGGTAKWLLVELLKRDLVDYVVQVYNKTDDPNTLFEYRISSSIDEVALGSKSVYYPVEMSRVLREIKNTPGRYVITGVPCFVKSIRLLQHQDPILKERIKFCFGIFCGHLKSKFYAEMIGWQLGVSPKELSYIDFRVKIPGAKANEKGVQAKSINNQISKPQIVQDVFGTNYGHGFFKYSACDFCDDVIAETADVSFGDAWLPEFMNQGTNMIVSRNPILSEILDNGIENKSLALNPSSPQQVYKSQEAGFRHRREGLAVRLSDKTSKGYWVPPKRFTTITSDKQRIKIFRRRVILTNKSFKTFRNAKKFADFSLFQKPMLREIEKYQKLYITRTNKQKLIDLLIALHLLNLALNIKRVFSKK